MLGLGSALCGRWVGQETSQALGLEDFVRLRDAHSQGSGGGGRGRQEGGNPGQEREFQLWHSGDNYSVICPRWPHPTLGPGLRWDVPNTGPPAAFDAGSEKIPWHEPGSLWGERRVWNVGVPVLWLEVWGFRVPWFAWLCCSVITFHNRGLESETLFTFQIPNKQHSYQ